MGLTDIIIEKVNHLSKDRQTEVLDFIEFVEQKVESEERAEWNHLSLESLTDDSDDEVDYTFDDLKTII